MQPRLVKWSTARLSSKFIKECSDGKSLDMWWLWLHSVSFNRLENQLERQELLFAWWLISDQQMRSHWGKTKLHCDPFIPLFFSLCNSDGLLVQVSTSLTLAEVASSVTTCSLLPLTLSASHRISPSYLLRLSTLPSLPSSPLSPSFPPCSPALVLWKRALSAGLNGAGPLEARTMGPSSEGSQSPWKRNKDPSAQEGPHSAPHTSTPTASTSPACCVRICMYVRVSVY